MKVAFAHDHKFLKHPDTDLVFTNGGKFPHTVWNRYLEHFDELVVLGRCLPAPTSMKETNAAVASRDQVSFHCIPDISNPKSLLLHQKEVDKKIAAALLDADALIARLPSEIGLAAIKIAKSLDLPYAVEVVACAWDGLWNYGNWQGKLYAPWATFRNRQAIAQAPFALYVTENFLQRRYPNRGITTAASNVEIDDITTPVRSKLSYTAVVKDRPFVLGMLGSVDTYYKGIDTALYALSRLMVRYPQLSLQIVARGDPTVYQQMAQRLNIDQHVHFLGGLPSGKAVYQFLDTVDLYLQPSKQEGLPRALIEAMSRGCVAVGSTAGGIPELLDPSCLHKPGDAFQLAERIQQALENPDWYQQMSSKNLRTAANYCSYILQERRFQFWKSFRKYVDQRLTEAVS